ncbi:MAG: hemolysin family protein [Anaerolineaceae bacterium]|jgi:putative hemolysin|nr:hemolysin family protein [Anaerolineaceae bacterium]
MNNIFLSILIIFILIIINGIFAMSEISLISARKVRLQQMSKDGIRSAQVALDISENPNKFLSTVQIGITLIGILSGALGGASISSKLSVIFNEVTWLQPYSEILSVTIVVLLTTYFSLVIGELIPKRLGLNSPEKIASAVAMPMKAISWLTSPIVKLLSASTDIGLKILGVEKSRDPIITEEEIKVLMKQGTQSGIFESAEEDMVTGIFRLGGRYIDSIMTPRTEIEWIDLEEPIEMILEQVIQSNHSRFPVATGELDNVQGMLLGKDLLSQSLNGAIPSIPDLIQSPLFVPDSTSALKALDLIKEAGAHAALVIDEFSGVLGMVTLYDVLKSIVGSIPTAGEEEEIQIIQREDGSWLLDGLLAIDDIKELLGIETLPEEDRVGFQTLGGFMMTMLDSIPEVGQHFDVYNMRFEIVDMDGRRVDKVLVHPINLDVQSNDDSASEI